METRHFEKYLLPLLDTLSPLVCPCCGNHLCREERTICTRCLLQLPWFENTPGQEDHAKRLLMSAVEIERCFSLIRYSPDSLSQSLIHKLKYHHWRQLGLVLGRMMGRKMMSRGMLADVDAIVPVPLHWTRQMHRGYNQSTAIAEGISEISHLPILRKLARRIRATPTQTSLTSMQRRENVQGAFLSQTTPLHHLLLVDDVLTTGATLSHLALAILEKNPHVRFSFATAARGTAN